MSKEQARQPAEPAGCPLQQPCIILADEEKLQPCLSWPHGEELCFKDSEVNEMKLTAERGQEVSGTTCSRSPEAPVLGKLCPMVGALKGNFRVFNVEPVFPCFCV